MDHHYRSRECSGIYNGFFTKRSTLLYKSNLLFLFRFRFLCYFWNRLLWFRSNAGSEDEGAYKELLTCCQRLNQILARYFQFPVSKSTLKVFFHTGSTFWCPKLSIFRIRLDIWCFFSVDRSWGLCNKKCLFFHRILALLPRQLIQA